MRAAGVLGVAPRVTHLGSGPSARLNALRLPSHDQRDTFLPRRCEWSRRMASTGGRADRSQSATRTCRPIPNESRARNGSPLVARPWARIRRRDRAPGPPWSVDRVSAIRTLHHRSWDQPRHFSLVAAALSTVSSTRIYRGTSAGPAAAFGAVRHHARRRFGSWRASLGHIGLSGDRRRFRRRQRLTPVVALRIHRPEVRS